MMKIAKAGIVASLTLVIVWLALSVPVVQAQPTGSTASYPVYAAIHMAANGTSSPITGAGVLHTVCINDQGASSNIATVYDNTAGSGTTLAVIDTVTTVGCQLYDAAYSTGLTVVMGTGTTADLTITYRPLR